MLTEKYLFEQILSQTHMTMVLLPATPEDEKGGGYVVTPPQGGVQVFPLETGSRIASGITQGARILTERCL